MPYSKRDDDRALNRMWEDMNREDMRGREGGHRWEAGIGVCLALLCFILVTCMLLGLGGCRAMHGLQQDIHHLTAPSNAETQNAYRD